MSASWTTKEYYNIYPISSTDNFLMTLLPVLEIFPIKSFYNTPDYSQLLRFLLILCEISSAVVLSEKHTLCWVLGAEQGIFIIFKSSRRELFSF
jgi:hypothetical protein